MDSIPGRRTAWARSHPDPDTDIHTIAHRNQHSRPVSYADEHRDKYADCHGHIYCDRHKYANGYLHYHLYSNTH